MRKLLLLSLVFLFATSFSASFAAADYIYRDTDADFTSGTLNNTRIDNNTVVLKVVPGVNVIWTPTDGVIVTDNADDQDHQRTIPSGDGGVIVVWQDQISGSGYKVYAQKLDKEGQKQWGPNGIIVCNFDLNDQPLPEIVTDGAGGVIITWQDDRASDFSVYAQRLDSSGTAQWTSDGVKVIEGGNKAGGNERRPKIVSDGNQGAIIACENQKDIYAQRIDKNGALQWADSGTPSVTNPMVVCNQKSGNQGNIVMIADGASGAIITWEDGRNSSIKPDIFAQRLDEDGVRLWSTGSFNGVEIASSGDNEDSVSLASDQLGNFFIAWRRNDGGDAVFVQYLDITNGSKKWTGYGVQVVATAALKTQQKPEIITDGDGGVIAVWEDDRSGTNDIYAQRLDRSGLVVTGWDLNGQVVCDAASDQLDPKIVSDGAQGAIITWADERQGPGKFDIYAERIARDGTRQWDPGNNGLLICDQTGDQIFPEIVPDDDNRAIIVWQDKRGADTDIYAQKIGFIYESTGTYTSDKIENKNSGFNNWDQFSWVGTGSITAKVRTAGSSTGLDTATYSAITNGGAMTSTDKWIQFEMTLNAAELDQTTPVLDYVALKFDTTTPSPTPGPTPGPTPTPTPDNDIPDISNVSLDNVFVRDGDVISKKPTVRATITDAGVGVDPSTVKISIDGTAYTPTFDTSTGATELIYSGSALTSASTHTVLISASDYNKNNATFDLSGLRILDGRKIIEQIGGPSPFSPKKGETTYIAYQLSENVPEVDVIIFSITGEMVYRDKLIYPSPGTHVGYNMIPWNGRNAHGEVVKNGAYIAFVKYGDDHVRVKIIVKN